MRPQPSWHKATQKVAKNNSKKTKKEEKYTHWHDLKHALSDLHEVLLEQGKEKRNTVKPLRKEKQDMKQEIIDTKLEEFNFHKYETHDIEDLLDDVNQDDDVDDINSAFEDFIH